MKLILLVTAVILIPVGLLISLLTPIPGGAFLFAVGLTLLICTSEWAAQRIRALRTRIQRVDQGMTWIEERMGPRIGDILQRTRPEADQPE